MAVQKKFFLGFLAILLIGFGFLMSDFWIAAALAILAAMILRPIHQRIERWCRGYRYIAAILTVGLACGLILIPLGGILATIIVEILHFSQNLAGYLQEGQLAQSIDALNAWLIDRLLPVQAWVDTDWNLREWLLGGANQLAKVLYQFSPKFLLSTANFSLQLVLWLVFMLVLFADGPRLYNYLMEIAPIAPRHERHITREVRGMVTAVFLGMVATAFVNAILMGIAFAICGIDRYWVWALITFGFSFIPVVGAFSIWAGAAIYLLTIGDWPYALGLTIFGFGIMAQADNIIKPLVMRGHVKIHPILLLLSILGGAKAMGAVGLIFGPVFLAILTAALQIYQEEYVAEKTITG